MANQTAAHNVVPLLAPERPLESLKAIFAAAGEDERMALMDQLMADLGDEERDRFLERHDLVSWTDVEAYYEDELGTAAAKEKRGPKPSVTPSLLEKMRQMDPKKLAEMKHVQMAIVFRAAASTCKIARDKVLGNSR
jgi:hypothetical protein